MSSIVLVAACTARERVSEGMAVSVSVGHSCGLGLRVASRLETTPRGSCVEGGSEDDGGEPDGDEVGTVAMDDHE